jgi:hypothetical protein
LSEMLFDGALAPETLCDADVWDRAKIDRLHTNSTQTITKTGLELFFRIVVSSNGLKGSLNYWRPRRAREQAIEIHSPYQLPKVTTFRVSER